MWCDWKILRHTLETAAVLGKPKLKCVSSVLPKEEKQEF